MAGSSDDLQKTAGKAVGMAGRTLRSVQQELKKVAIVFLIGFGASFYVLREIAWPFLKQVTRSQMPADLSDSVSFIAQTPFDVILLQVKIGMLVGALATIPAILYLARHKLADKGYKPVEQVGPIKLAILGVAGVLLFIGGLSYGYLLFFPFVFRFLASNAVAAGFQPSYSIVLWTEFVFFLSVSLGFAAQLPLIVPALSYYGVVPYETFRDNWRKIVAGFFLLGAMLSPPDPFTQLLWALPLVALFGLSLYIARVAVLLRRSRESMSVTSAAIGYWNYILGLGALAGGVTYVFYQYGGRTVVNQLLAMLGSRHRVLELGQGLPLSQQETLAVYITAAVIIGLIGGMMVALYRDIASKAEPTPLEERSVQEIKRTPLGKFAELSDDEAAKHAAAAANDGHPDRARAIIRRHNKALDALSSSGSGDNREEEGPVMQRLIAMAEDNDGVGGYLSEIAFVLNAVRSKGFQLGLAFFIGVAATFFWLYQGGIGVLFEVFLSQLPAEITVDQVNVIALHPVEALVFEAKLSGVVGILFTAPLFTWYAWPALRELNLVSRSRNVLFGVTGALLVGFLVGLLIGYLVVAPNILSYLAADAIGAGMKIKYRISDFFWLIFALTAGIGVLVDIPVAMIVAYRIGFPFEIMYERWRFAVFAIVAAAIFIAPAGVVTALLLSLPVVAAYLVGLGIVWTIDKATNMLSIGG